MLVKAKTGLMGLAICLVGCSTAPKQIVNEPLKLSGPVDAKTHICGKTGCDEHVEKLCEDQTTQILDKQFIDKSKDVKNNYTGKFDRRINKTTHYVYRCID